EMLPDDVAPQLVFPFVLLQTVFVEASRAPPGRDAEQQRTRCVAERDRGREEEAHQQQCREEDRGAGRVERRDEQPAEDVADEAAGAATAEEPGTSERDVCERRGG